MHISPAGSISKLCVCLLSAIFDYLSATEETSKIHWNFQFSDLLFILDNAKINQVIPCYRTDFYRVSSSRDNLER